MSFKSSNYHYNGHRSSSLLMDDRRARMLEYSNNITNKNMGLIHYTSYGNYGNKLISNNIYGYSNKFSEQKENLNIEKYNNNKNSFNQYKNRTSNFYNTRKTRDYSEKYSSFEEKSNFNPKVEFIQHKNNYNDIYNFDKKGKGYLDIGNKYINHYIPSLDRIKQSTYNQRDKVSLFDKKFNELEKNDNIKKSYLDGIYNKNEKDKLNNKYLDEKIEKIKNESDNNNTRLITNNLEKNKEININDTNKNNEENKDTNVELTTKDNHLGKYEKEKSNTHNKSNINRSKSVAPGKNIESENSKISNSLVGFNNLGATCYMNSALQNIIHCKSFIDKIKAFLNTTTIDSQNKIITNSFLNLCNSLIDFKNKETNKYLSYTYSLNSISPSNFKSNFCLKHKDYNRGQHDSIEFLRTLLDDMSKEININQNISAYKELNTEGKSKEDQSKEYHNFFKSRENSIIVDIFYNQIINIFTCSCGFESYSFQKLLDIPLLLPNKNYKIDLSSLINEYFKKEVLEWSTKCEKCQTPKLKHSKIMKFCILNDIVIFSLQRFDPVLSIKNNIRVSFKELLDLKDFCDTDLYKENTKYRLLGTINHIGNINYGHYYSYIRIGEIWYEFNDSIVQKVYKMDYDGSSFCVLFYEKYN